VRRYASIAVVCTGALTVAASIGFRTMLQPSDLGDARMGWQVINVDVSQAWARVHLPAGVHQAFSVTMWARLRPMNPEHVKYTLSTYAHWTPGPVEYSNPDLLDGAGGFGAGGTNLTAAGGSVTVASFPWQPYTDATPSNRWPKGVYTIAGSSTSAVTVTLGGDDVVLGPGDFNRNAIPGPADSVIISGAGVAEVGISRTPCHRFFWELDGVGDPEQSGLFTPDSMVTNEVVMLSWRFRCEAAGQIYRSDLGRLAAFDMLLQTRTNAWCAGYHSSGIYTVGLLGPVASPAYEWEIFDARLLTRWLTDAELERVHLNGVQEIGRRGIPQWR
jgi:hypothetical protein